MSLSPPSWHELKRRKIVQWAVAYLAGAWLATQLVRELADAWGLPDPVVQAVHILLVLGFFVTLVLAWYHGEKGRQRVSGPELLMIAGIFVVAGVALTAVRGQSEAEGRGGASAARGDQPEPAVTLPQLAAPDDSIPFRSVAVLPLDNLSAAAEHAYLAGAMTEQITHALAQVPELFVPSRNSATKFPESGQTVGEFARELGVAHVIEGSVQRVDDDVRIIVQLIDALTGEHVWSEEYNRTLADLLDLQVEIAVQVAEKLASTLTERGRERIRARSSDDAEAMDLVLRATEGFQDLDYVQAARSGIPLVKAAVARDPEFANAWEILSLMYSIRSIVDDEGEALRDSAAVFIDRAIELASEPSYEAWTRGLRAKLLGDQSAAIRIWRAAVRHNPSDVGMIRGLAEAYYDTGDLVGGIEHLLRVVRLDPLNPDPWSELGYVYAHLGLDERADRALRKAIAVEPVSFSPWEYLLDYRMAQGRFAEARAAVDSAGARGWPYVEAQQGAIDLWQGDVERAHARLESALASQEGLYLEMLMTAHVRLVQGDTAGAKELLERSEEILEGVPVGQPTMYAVLQLSVIRGDTAAAAALREYAESGGRRSRWIRRDPVFDRVWHDPEFEAELVKLEEIIERQRRQVERMLADEGGGR